MNPKLKNIPASLVAFAALFAAFSSPATASAAGYKQIDLISDVPGMAAKTDPNLVNPWGLLVAPWGDLYVVNNGSGVSTVYKSSGALQEVVSLQPPPGEPSGGTHGLLGYLQP